MTEKCKEPNYLLVAGELATFLAEKYGENVKDPEVLEGMWIAMQMVGGPRLAAQVIGYCSVKVD